MGDSDTLGMTGFPILDPLWMILTIPHVGLEKKSGRVVLGLRRQFSRIFGHHAYMCFLKMQKIS